VNRRDFLRRTALLATGVAFGAPSRAAEADFPVVRVAEEKRRFKSRAVERTIETIRARIGNRELGWMFENCFPNALDTTVDFDDGGNRPDTFVMTGDTDAMSLRDSAMQVWPYLPFMRNDSTLKQLIAGVINRQTRCILKDPYANAFCKNDSQASPWKDDFTELSPGVYERKWALDSLCYPVRLAFHYWKTTKDRAPFDESWRFAMLRIVRTFREQQRKDSPGPYRFQRRTKIQGETLAGDGVGHRAKPVGLIYSMFRPSDDATLFPLLVPSNFLAVGSLRQGAELLSQIHGDSESAAQCQALADEVERALREHAVVIHRKYSRILPYEIDGYGNDYCMDEGAVPSLLSLPYFDVLSPGSPLYLNTRRFILSESNAYYCVGKAASGPGGPRVGRDMIWPLALLAQALTSNDDLEVRRCLLTLRKTHAGTGFMHEAFHKNDPSRFTRPWFPAANTLFGELVLKSFRERPHVLN